MSVVDATLAFQLRRSLANVQRKHRSMVPMQCIRCLLFVSRTEVETNKAFPGNCPSCGGTCKEYYNAT